MYRRVIHMMTSPLSFIVDKVHLIREFGVSDLFQLARLLTGFTLPTPYTLEHAYPWNQCPWNQYPWYQSCVLGDTLLRFMPLTAREGSDWYIRRCLSVTLIATVDARVARRRPRDEDDCLSIESRFCFLVVERFTRIGDFWSVERYGVVLCSTGANS